MTILEEIEGYTSYTLAGMADCGCPDSLSSPGARMLDSVRDGVVELIKRGEITFDDFDDNGQLHEVADSGPSSYTHTLWSEFVDLCAYQEEPEFDDTWGTDLNKAAATALYQICSRLAFALAEEWRDGWECPVCGDSGQPIVCSPDECYGEPDDQVDADTPDAASLMAYTRAYLDQDTPAGAPESTGEPLPVRTPGAAMAEVGEPVSDVLTGPVDLAPVSDPILGLIERAEATDMGIRVAWRARLADAAVSRFRWRVWTGAAVLAVIGVSLVMWKGGVW